MKPTFLFALFALSLFSFACKKTEDPALNLPECIKLKIEAFEYAAALEGGGFVREYLFDDGKAYVFTGSTNTVDPIYPVYGVDCESLGILGGADRNTQINGVDFYDTATYVQVVWAN